MHIKLKAALAAVLFLAAILLVLATMFFLFNWLGAVPAVLAIGITVLLVAAYNTALDHFREEERKKSRK